MSRTEARLATAAGLLRQSLKPAAWRRALPAAPQRILVLHHLLLGDTLMLAPLLAKLAARYPQAERFLACPTAILPLFAARPYGVTALGWNPRSRAGLAALFAAAPFDLVILPAENRYAPLARALGARHVLGFAGDRPGWKNWLLDTARPFPESPATFADFCARLVEGQAPAPMLASDWPLAAPAAFSAPAAPYAVLHLGASTPLKHWPSERWLALASWLESEGITPVWSAGAKETALVQAADPQGRFASLAGQLDLLQLAHLLRGAALAVCPDTGVTHLARIVGVPTVALFGPGSPVICGAGEYWARAPFTALSVPISCRNQHHTFRREAAWIQRCGRSWGEGAGQCAQPRCMEELSLEMVRAACAARLAASRA